MKLHSHQRRRVTDGPRPLSALPGFGDSWSAARRRAGGALRTLVVGAATLGILLVCFSIYQYSQMIPEPEKSTGPRLPSPPIGHPGDAAAGDPRNSPGIPVGSGAVVGPGRDIKLAIYPREGTKARVEIAVRTYNPTGNAPNEYLLVDPEVRMRTADGRAVRATAREGYLEARQRGAGKLDPQRGRLVGEVVLELDRLTLDEREELPVDRRDVIDPEDVVRVELDEIEFDMEYAKIVVPRGRLHLTARDIEFAATDLEVRFDETRGRIDYLRIMQGGRIVLINVGDRLDMTLPGGGSGGAPEYSTLAGWLRATIEERLAAARAAPVGESAPDPLTASAQSATREAITVAPDGAIVFDPSAKGPEEPKGEVRYFARFEQDVHARQLVGDSTLSHLQADVLDILRMVSDEDKDRAREPGSPAAAKDQARGTPAPEKPQERIVLEWAGRLVVEACTPDDPRCAADVRARVVATGAPVRVFTPDGDAACAELRYEPDGARVWMTGTEAEPVLVHSLEQGTMTGRTLFSEQDEKALAIRIQGPGTLRGTTSDSMLQPGAAADTESTVAFAELLELHGRHENRTRLDLSGGIVSQRVRVLDRAVFTGGVELRESDTGMTAEQMTLHFLNRAGRGGDQSIDRVDATGNVRMTQGSDRLACDDLKVTLGTGTDGRTVPRTAVARGDVEAVQQRRTIRARDELTVDFELYERPAPPFDAAKAYQAAVRAGIDPQSVDWNARRREHEASLHTEVGVKHLRATTDVTVIDPAQGLELTAQRLDCDVVNGQEISRAVVHAGDSAPAVVRLGAFTVSGPEIRLNVPDEWAEVPGSGRLSFLSRKDLDGRQVAEPVPVAITWDDWMKYQGRENRAVFSGNVHAASGSNTTFDTQQLMVEFDDVAPSDATVDSGQAAREWWIFSDIVEPDSQRSGSDPLRGSRVGKEPAYLLATGRAVAVTSEFDAGGTLVSRARLSGPKLSVNLRQEVSKMLIEGPGDLTLEDFRPAVAAAPPKAAGLFGVDGDAGPSKTLIEWEESMWYDFSIDQTRFEGNVGLKHFSGLELARVFGDSTSATPDLPPGRATFLTTDVLTADFLDRAAASATREDTRMGGLSTDRLRQFRAAGSVTLRDKTEGLSLWAHDLTYERDRSLLIVQGAPHRKARIVLRRPGEYPRDLSLERFFFNFKTRQIERLTRPGGRG